MASNGGALRRAKTKWELDAIQITKLRNKLVEQAIEGETAAARLVFEYTHTKPAAESEIEIDGGLEIAVVSYADTNPK